MAILESGGRLAATLLEMAQTRLALASVEMQEQSQRYLGYFLMSLLSLILAGDRPRAGGAVRRDSSGTATGFAAAPGMARRLRSLPPSSAIKVRTGFAARPALLGATIAELNKDFECPSTPRGTAMTPVNARPASYPPQCREALLARADAAHRSSARAAASALESFPASGILKMPLTIAGVVLGMIATRSGRRCRS